MDSGGDDGLDLDEEKEEVAGLGLEAILEPKHLPLAVILKAMVVLGFLHLRMLVIFHNTNSTNSYSTASFWISHSSSWSFCQKLLASTAAANSVAEATAAESSAATGASATATAAGKKEEEKERFYCQVNGQVGLLMRPTVLHPHHLHLWCQCLSCFRCTSTSSKCNQLSWKVR